MLKSLLLAFIGIALLCGCRSRYEITLTNSDKITTFSKPKRVEGQYFFKDATGQERRVSATRVIQIERKSPWEETKDPFSVPAKK
jgi:hypothetical protein